MQESKCSGYSGHLRAKFLGNMARPCCNVDWKMWEETEIDHRAYAFNRNNSCTVGDIFSHLCTRNKRVISRNRNSKLSKGQSLGKYDRPLYSSKVYRGRDIRKIEAFCHSWSISLTCTTQIRLETLWFFPFLFPQPFFARFFSDFHDLRAIQKTGSNRISNRN